MLVSLEVSIPISRKEKEHGKAHVKGCMDYGHITSAYTSMARKQGHLAAKEAGGCHIIKCSGGRECGYGEQLSPSLFF